LRGLFFRMARRGPNAPLFNTPDSKWQVVPMECWRNSTSMLSLPLSFHSHSYTNIWRLMFLSRSTRMISPVRIVGESSKPLRLMPTLSTLHYSYNPMTLPQGALPCLSSLEDRETTHSMPFVSSVCLFGSVQGALPEPPLSQQMFPLLGFCRCLCSTGIPSPRLSFERCSSIILFSFFPALSSPCSRV